MFSLYAYDIQIRRSYVNVRCKRSQNALPSERHPNLYVVRLALWSDLVGFCFLLSLSLAQGACAVSRAGYINGVETPPMRHEPARCQLVLEWTPTVKAPSCPTQQVQRTYQQSQGDVNRAPPGHTHTVHPGVPISSNTYKHLCGCSMCAGLWWNWSHHSTSTWMWQNWGYLG